MKTPDLNIDRRTGTRLIFFVIGVYMSAWAALIPAAQMRANLDVGSLGLLLLCLGTGSLIAMPFAGHFTTRFGCRVVFIVCVVTASIALSALVVFSNVFELTPAVLVLGASLGVADCVANIQAVVVEVLRP